MDDDAPRQRYVFKPRAEITWAIIAAAVVALGAALAEADPTVVAEQPRVWITATLVAVSRAAIAAGKNALVDMLDAPGARE